jgi:hypothetical protein
MIIADGARDAAAAALMSGEDEEEPDDRNSRARYEARMTPRAIGVLRENCRIRSAR